MSLLEYCEIYNASPVWFREPAEGFPECPFTVVDTREGVTATFTVTDEEAE